MLKVSVVIPAYNQAQFLGEAIQSVLDQTYPNFELLVVNDASPDDTVEVVGQFSDPRIRYIAHEENRGLPATRNSGMRAASGELIALLDADDFFHPEKLERHVKFHQENPDIGVTYNARFELNHSSSTIRELWVPPQTVGLSDLLKGWPFSPSDMVIHRDWITKSGLFNESLVNGGEDLDFQIRLILSGCQFARVNGALNYRRYHSGRGKRNLHCRLNEYLCTINRTINDPRFPKNDTLTINEAYENSYLEVAWYALTQHETQLGQDCISKAITINPSLLKGVPSKLVKFLADNSINDREIDHEILLRSIFNQLPTEMGSLYYQIDWAIARGLLLKGIRETIWGQHTEGNKYFQQALSHGARVDEPLLLKICHDLINYEGEFGTECSQAVIEKLLPQLEMFTNKFDLRKLMGIIYINKVFKSYNAEQYDIVLRLILRTVMIDPRLIYNRGILSIFTKSLLSKWGHPLNLIQF